MTTDSTWTGPVHPWVAEASEGVRFGIALGPRYDFGQRRHFVQMVEDLGFDSYWDADHPLRLPDCVTTLTYASTFTRRIRLGTLVHCVPYRHPAMIARTAADIDAISGGRFVLGLGIGDFASEFQQLGIPFPKASARQAMLEEAVEIIRRLLAGEVVTFGGQFFNVTDAVLQPKHEGTERIPIIIAGGGEKTTLRQVARYADVANFGEHTFTGGARDGDDFRRKYGVLKSYCVEYQRPFSSILRSHLTFPLVLASSADRLNNKLNALNTTFRALVKDSIIAGLPSTISAHYQKLIDAGVQYFILAINGGDDETVELFASKVRPELQEHWRERACQRAESREI